ncbi:hypothetical protein KIPB_000602 [Kipferlia bialata]|uniref:Nitroreductase domain-containing protein n=1 Tax=Kipferlia bialata TaxID=797122 RepID=A0A9K3CNU8_9EUKA|nr:hypothetical protein KIPB_000602 [Kipferlia bialata]|eukprot:g602.t1
MDARGDKTSYPYGARRSVRKFRGDPVPSDVVTDILETMRTAPSAGNTQDVHVYVVTKQGTKDSLCHAAHNQGMVSCAPLVLVVCGAEEHSRDRDETAATIDTGVFVTPYSYTQVSAILAEAHPQV